MEECAVRFIWPTNDKTATNCISLCRYNQWEEPEVKPTGLRFSFCVGRGQRKLWTWGMDWMVPFDSSSGTHSVSIRVLQSGAFSPLSLCQQVCSSLKASLMRDWLRCWGTRFLCSLWLSISHFLPSHLSDLVIPPLLSFNFFPCAPSAKQSSNNRTNTVCWSILLEECDPATGWMDHSASPHYVGWRPVQPGPRIDDEWIDG